MDGIISGIFLLALLLFFSPMIMTFPVRIFRYFYIVPVGFVFILIMTIPRDLQESLKWKSGLGRLRFFAYLSLGVSPFWVWWHADINNSYFLANIGIFVFSLILGLYNLISVASASVEERSRVIFFLFTRFARMVLIYVMIAPVLAFFITIWVGQGVGRDVIIILYEVRGWYLLVFGLPLFLSLYILWYWRQVLVAEIHAMSRG